MYCDAVRDAVRDAVGVAVLPETAMFPAFATGQTEGVFPLLHM
jgi:hypothetical protein